MTTIMIKTLNWMKEQCDPNTFRISGSTDEIAKDSGFNRFDIHEAIINLREGGKIRILDIDNLGNFEVTLIG